MEQLNAFMEKAKSDNELTEKLNTLAEKGAGADEYIKIAAEYDFTITEDDFEKANKANELSEEQLEDVAGGDDGGWVRHSCCWFTPTGNRTKDGNSTLVQCNSSCKNLFTGYMCSCHGTYMCRNKWHTLSSDTDLLADTSYSNHRAKVPPSFNA